MIRSYLEFLGLIAYFVFTWGVLGPFLVSAKSTVAVLLGYLVCGLSIPVCVFWTLRLVRQADLFDNPR